MLSHIRITVEGVLFSAIWASAFVVGKQALDVVAPLTLLCLRFALAGIVMTGIAAVKRELSSPRLVRDCAVLGGLNNSLYLGLCFLGLMSVSAELTVLIVSTAPFLTIGLSKLWGRSATRAQIIGAVIGFIGVFIVLEARMQIEASPFGIFLIALGTAAFALGTVYYKEHATGHRPMAVNGVQNLFGAAFLLPFIDPSVLTWAELGNPAFLYPLIYLVVAVSIVDFLLWLSLIRRVGAATASGFHLLNPIFGVVFSVLLFNATLLASDVLGGLIVIVGLSVTLNLLPFPNRNSSL